MRKIYLFLFVISGLIINSCIKHEIIPAPEYTVDLTYSFAGVIDGQNVSLSPDSAAYICNPTQEKNLVSPPQLSSAIYYSTISSSSATAAMEIGLGKIDWDRSGGDDPALNDFNDFFIATANAFPSYKDFCDPGFRVVYTDENGAIYKSSENSTQYQDVKFTNIKQDSDATGDYSKFTCTFNCYVYYDSGTAMQTGKDSLKIQMGKFKGWFKK
ncbi:MAG: hypothetical protein ACON4M_09440 [Crocinitomicaceae bacterium]